jgi:hypothetical protein
MSIATLDHYQLAADFEQRVADCDFPAGVWNVAAELAEVGQATTAFELARRTGQSPDYVRDALEQLISKQLVGQNRMSWKEFTALREEARSAAKPATIGMGAGARVVPVSATYGATMPQPQAGVSAGQPPAQAKVGFRLGSISPQQPAAGTSSAWAAQTPSPAPAEAPKPTVAAAPPIDKQPIIEQSKGKQSKGKQAKSEQPKSEESKGEESKSRLLRPMLKQIENHKGGGAEGQSLVHQVLLRVPYELLEEEGIKSLHLVDDHTVIQNPVLQAAIIKAAMDVAGIDLS